MRLSREDRETVISFNEAASTAFVFTCNQGWIRHLEKLGLKPTEVHRDEGKVYAKEYQLSKKWVGKPRKPRQLSAERKRRLAAVLGKARKSKGGLS